MLFFTSSSVEMIFLPGDTQISHCYNFRWMLLVKIFAQPQIITFSCYLIMLLIKCKLILMLPFQVDALKKLSSVLLTQTRYRTGLNKGLNMISVQYLFLLVIIVN